MVWVLVGVRSCVAADAGHSLVTPFFPVWSVKDRSLQWTLGKSQIYYPEHILGYGRRKDLLLSCRGFWLFSDRLIGGRDGGGPCTALSPGLRSGGLESKFRWGHRPQDRRVMGWSCLCLGYKRGVCFWGTQLGALIRESLGDPIQLVWGLAP